MIWERRRPVWPACRHCKITIWSTARASSYWIKMWIKTRSSTAICRTLIWNWVRWWTLWTILQITSRSMDSPPVLREEWSTLRVIYRLESPVPISRIFRWTWAAQGCANPIKLNNGWSRRADHSHRIMAWDRDRGKPLIKTINTW